MTLVYCDRTDCAYYDKEDDTCTRAGIKIESDVSFSGAYCASVEIKKTKEEQNG